MILSLFRLALLSLIMAVFLPVSGSVWANETPITEGQLEKKTIKPVVNVPIMTFRQQVDCVVTVRQHPDVLQATIDQKERMIEGSLVIRNERNRKQAKELATEFIRIIKKKSLDEEPEAKQIGKGLYTYKVEVTRANKAVLATGIKKFDETDIKWAINDEGETDKAILSDETPQ